MRSVKWRRHQQINVTSLTGKHPLSALSISEVWEDFSIDLGGTVLNFIVPKRTLESIEFTRGYPKDLRPFVNTVSKTEYQYSPQTKRGTCEFYESGWWLFTKRLWKKESHGIVKLLASLETPAPNEYKIYPNLFEETNFRNWLSLYYRDRQSILDRATFSTQADGTLEIEFLDEHEVPQFSPSQVPLQKFPEFVSGQSCYFIYLKRGVIEFNLPISKRDVFQMHFKLGVKTEDKSIQSQLNSEILKLAQQVMSTIKITFSEHALNDQREAGTLLYKSGDLLGN